MEPKKPTFLIIGSAKCGTTALASILEAHPDCCMSRPKEVYFFNNDSNYEKGWEWYRQVFTHHSNEPVVGEATPHYCDRDAYWHNGIVPSPKTVKRICEFNSEMKIVYMVRHPLERQVSAWKMLWDQGMCGHSSTANKWALKGFDYWMRMAIDAKWCDGVRYCYQLEPFLERFPAGQVLVSFLEDWERNKNGEVARIMQFLGLNSEMRTTEFQEDANRAADRIIVIDRQFLKRVRLHPLSRMVVPRFPASWRDWARSTFTRIRQPAPPKSDISSATKAEFIRYVKPDSEKFLKQWGKPADFWSLD
jgi:Sulfotransferase domain